MRGSIASHSQNTCLALRSLVRAFIQLEVGDLEVLEKAFMQDLSVRARAREPGGDRGLMIAENPFGSRNIQRIARALTALGQRGEKGFSDDTKGYCVEQ